VQELQRPERTGPRGSNSSGSRADAAALLSGQPPTNELVIDRAGKGRGIRGNGIVIGIHINVGHQLRHREGNVGRREVVNVERGVVEIEERLVLGVIENMQP